MKKALMGVLLLGAACGINAQEASSGATQTNAATEFSGTSAAQVQLFSVNTSGTSTAPANSAEENSAPLPTALPATPAPAANPKYIFGERDDYRWQLGVGFEYFRFQSGQFNSNLFGLNTTLTYYTNSWFGVEGDVINAFSADSVSGNDHAKLFTGAGGFRIGGRRAKWEPWGHALVGGSHLQPQTAGGDRWALTAIAGGGVDYRVHARLSFRLEGDWVYTGYFGTNQNNFQAIAGAVLHF
jgi:hypothetical protein